MGRLVWDVPHRSYFDVSSQTHSKRGHCCCSTVKFSSLSLPAMGCHFTNSPSSLLMEDPALEWDPERLGW